MDTSQILFVAHGALALSFQVAGPPLIAGMVVGIAFGLLQAMTQIHEATLTIIPKMIAVVAALAIGGPWMFRSLTEFAVELYARIPEVLW